MAKMELLLVTRVRRKSLEGPIGFYRIDVEFGGLRLRNS